MTVLVFLSVVVVVVAKVIFKLLKRNLKMKGLKDLYEIFRLLDTF